MGKAHDGAAPPCVLPCHTHVIGSNDLDFLFFSYLVIVGVTLHSVSIGKLILLAEN